MYGYIYETYDTVKNKYYIKLYGSRIPNGYNISLGGDGGGHFQKHSEETKRKLSEIHKGKRRHPKRRWNAGKDCH